MFTKLSLSHTDLHTCIHTNMHIYTLIHTHTHTPEKTFVLHLTRTCPLGCNMSVYSIFVRMLAEGDHLEL